MLKNKAFNIYFLLIIFILSSASLSAQEDEEAMVSVPHPHAPGNIDELPPLSEYEKNLKYSTDDRPVVIFFSGAYKKDNWTETTFTVTKRLKFFSPEDNSYSRIQFYLKPYEVAENIKVKVVNPDGSVKTQSFDHPEDVIVSYNDTWGPQLLYTYTIPGVREGSIVDYSYTIITSLGSGLRFNYWYIQDMAYTILCRFTIDAPRDFMPFKSSLENIAMSLAPDTEIIKERKIVTWQFADVPSVAPEPLMPSPSQLFGRLIVDYQWPSSFTSEPKGYWRQVGRSQSQRVRRFVENSITLETLARNITGAGDEPQEKVGKISNWIQKNIRNLASLPAEQLLDGSDLVHEEVSDVDELLDAGQGNVLEINKMAVGLMKAAGLEAYLSFAVSREKGVLHYNILDTTQLNCSFVAVRLYGDEVIFSNPAAFDAPADVIPWYLQGAIAVICTPGGSVFYRIPLERQEKNISRTTISLTVDFSGGATGTVEHSFSGQESITLRNATYTLPSDMQEGYIKMLLLQDFPGARIDKLSFSGIDRSEENIQITAELYIPGYLSVNGRRMRIASELEILPFRSETLAEVRKYPISFKYPHKKRIEERVKLPHGFVLDHQPVNNKGLSDLGSTTDILRIRQGGYEREREISLNRIFFKPEEVEEVKTFFKFTKYSQAK